MLKSLARTICFAALLAPVSANAMDKSEVEKIVREYLLSHPEILNEMVAELQKREELGAVEKAKIGIAENKDALYSDGYSYVAGNPNGDVTLVEFFDYRCGYCKKVRPELVELLKEDGNLRLIVKELPVLGEVSDEASKAAMAALNQGGELYWKFHQAMLSADGIDSAAIYDIAAGQGLDVARLKKDMEDKVIAERIEKNHMLAKSIGVDGTPAFVVGDKLQPGALPKEELKALIETQRKGG